MQITERVTDEMGDVGTGKLQLMPFVYWWLTQVMFFWELAGCVTHSKHL